MKNVKKSTLKPSGICSTKIDLKCGATGKNDLLKKL